MKKTVVIVALSILCIMGVLETKNFLADDLSDVQSQIDDVQSQIAAENENLNKIEDEITSLDDEISSVQDEINNSQATIDSLNSKDNELETKITSLTDEINDEIGQNNSLLVGMQRLIHTNAIISTVFSGDTSSTIYQRIQGINTIVKAMSKSIFSCIDLKTQLKEDQDELENNKTTIVQQQQILETKNDDLLKKRQELSTKEANSNAIADEMKKQIGLLKMQQKELLENMNDDTYLSDEQKIKVMEASNISQSDYEYVDYIVSRESSWNYKATNPLSGSYGLCQALPPSKMASAGDDWENNPITQMKWCNSYAEERYGSWKNAQAFWKENYWW